MNVLQRSLYTHIRHYHISLKTTIVISYMTTVANSARIFLYYILFFMLQTANLIIMLGVIQVLLVLGFHVLPFESTLRRKRKPFENYFTKWIPHTILMVGFCI